jgi:hypothetical protein
VSAFNGLSPLSEDPEDPEACGLDVADAGVEAAVEVVAEADAGPVRPLADAALKLVAAVLLTPAKRATADASAAPAAAVTAASGGAL